MLRFVVISSKKENVEEYKILIDKAMINHNIYYEKHIFTNNDKDLDKFCTENSSSLVFIVENSNSVNAIKVVDKIKSQYKLFNTFIVVIDKENQLNKMDIINRHLFLANIVDNNSGFEISLNSIINIIYNCKKFLAFYSDKLLHKIPFDEILYIEKELNTKKSIIVCKKKRYSIYKSIVEIEKQLDERFIKSHQSAIINKDNINTVDFINNVIIFSDGQECNLISRQNKKALKTIITV